MRPSSEFLHGESSLSTHFRFRHGSSGELSEEEDDTVTMAKMIEQHKKWMMEEGTPLQFQHNNLGRKKEEHVTIQGRKEEECVTIQVEPDAPQMQAAQGSFNHSGPMADSESGIMFYAVLIEPDATQMQGVAEQSSCSISRPMDESESGSSIMFYAVPIILVVAEILLSLHLFEVI